MAQLKVLFICIGNSCRSPMAEAIARGLGRGRVIAYSAGIAPLGRVAEPVLAILAEMGYPHAGLRSKGLDEVPLVEVEVVVSLIGEHGLRMLPMTVADRREAWSIRDPYGDDREVYRAVGRTLETRIARLLADLETSHPG